MTVGRRLAAAPVLLAGVAVCLALTAAAAQTRLTYTKGQSLAPAFEGWWPNDDGSFTMFFGYMNSNWEEEFDIPVGPDNNIEPGGPDQGQPTHFYPRRNPFLFTIRVPKERADRELVWTLTSHGKTARAFASLKGDYRIDKQVMSMEVGGDFGSQSDALRENIPPVIELDGQPNRQVRVGQPLTLVAVASDPDNLPARRDGPGGRRGGPANPADALYRPPSVVVPTSGPGLRLSWIVYRGPARHVTFDPVQMKTWTETRPYANSPWSPPYLIPEPPPGGKWTTTATFAEPGTYQLRAVASDGSLFTYANVSVTVSR
jgi:hypothetical protein